VRRRLTLAELGRMTEKARKKALGDLVKAAMAPATGRATALQRQIREYEKRYELTTERMREELSAGRRAETADICDWLMLAHQWDLHEAHRAKTARA
jgi:hypothetical protein